jgi:5'(3')-deoxyribonucleotidase
VNMKPRLAIDMDEVIADAHSAHVSWLGTTYGYAFREEQFDGVALNSLILPEHALAMEHMLHTGHIFRDYAVMPGSQLAVKRLMGRFDVFITTAAMEYPASCEAKFAWLREHFAFISPLNIVFCGDKSILAADYLVDDNERHFARFRGQGVLFSAPHNRRANWLTVVRGWDEAVKYLESQAS